jgi:hypothetical protein
METLFQSCPTQNLSAAFHWDFPQEFFTSDAFNPAAQPSLSVVQNKSRQGKECGCHMAPTGASTTTLRVPIADKIRQGTASACADSEEL